MRYKYPRTPHLPWSPGSNSDDKILKDTSHFEGKRVVVTEKFDGENTSLYCDYLHARSIDSAHHPSRDWVKGYHACFSHFIPEGWRICGENLYATHSIEYSSLESYFLAFSIWDNEICLDYDQFEEWCGLLSLSTPQTLYLGLWDEDIIKNLEKDLDTTRVEGYVVRLFDSFFYQDFHKSVAKWVRTGHVQTDKHWMFSKIVTNKVKE